MAAFTVRRYIVIHVSNTKCIRVYEKQKGLEWLA